VYRTACQNTTLILSSSDRSESNLSDNFSYNYNGNYKTVPFSLKNNKKYYQSFPQNMRSKAASLFDSYHTGATLMLSKLHLTFSVAHYIDTESILLYKYNVLYSMNVHLNPFNKSPGVCSLKYPRIINRDIGIIWKN
jgi:hypothetical protein